MEKFLSIKKGQKVSFFAYFLKTTCARVCLDINIVELENSLKYVIAGCVLIRIFCLRAKALFVFVKNLMIKISHHNFITMFPSKKIHSLSLQMNVTTTLPEKCKDIAQAIVNAQYDTDILYVQMLKALVDSDIITPMSTTYEQVKRNSGLNGALIILLANELCKDKLRSKKYCGGLCSDYVSQQTLILISMMIITFILLGPLSALRD